MPQYLLVLDTPGIKQFVFGTDPLREIQGASALLHRLNQKMEPYLRDRLAEHGARLADTVFTGGGAGQFIVDANDRTPIWAAVDKLSQYYHQETGGEVRLAFGIAELAAVSYTAAIRVAHEQLHRQRDRGFGQRAVRIFPLVQECQSASHLPASYHDWDRPNEERRFLSESSRQKRDARNDAQQSGRWSEWMDHLARKYESWPTDWSKLRCRDFDDVGGAHKRGEVGLVYADGNAMGRLMQELPDRDTCHTFSRIVDESLCQACFEALDQVCRNEINDVRQGRKERLPADILLLGGDDLLVLLPADRALPFAHEVMERFTQRTREELDQVKGASAGFFRQTLPANAGLTISCGVALAGSSYPFYLLLDLAEELLKSAKTAGSADSAREKYWAPAYVDFHRVTGSSSHELKHVRKDDYHVTEAPPAHPRTLRPYSLAKLEKLQQAVAVLRHENFPPSKLHALFEEAMQPSWQRAERGVREIFSRCRQTSGKHERAALWAAVSKLGGEKDFPWCEENRHDGTKSRPTPIADIVEAYDLFGTENAP